MTEPLRSPKRRAWHLDRSAFVYVRQSTPQQVIDHQESTARQYALADRAITLGWTRDRITTIDDDLGKSGQSIEGRPGFQRVPAEAAHDHADLIRGLEMSRRARSPPAWPPTPRRQPPPRAVPPAAHRIPRAHRPRPSC
mgnify:CR=1 FL=1